MRGKTSEGLVTKGEEATEDRKKTTHMHTTETQRENLTFKDDFSYFFNRKNDRTLKISLLSRSSLPPCSTQNLKIDINKRKKAGGYLARARSRSLFLSSPLTSVEADEVDLASEEWSIVPFRLIIVCSWGGGWSPMLEARNVLLNSSRGF